MHTKALNEHTATLAGHGKRLREILDRLTRT